MEPTIIETSADPVSFWRRPELPIFETEYWNEGKWWVIIACFWIVGLIYTVILYARESKSIHPVWCVLLGLMRLCVYALLGFGFMLRSERTERKRIIIPAQYAKVAIVIDASLSMSEIRDTPPSEGGSLKDMPSRTDELIDKLLANDKIKFFDRLDKFHVTLHRFAGDLDEGSWDFAKGSFQSSVARTELLKKFRDIEKDENTTREQKDAAKKALEATTWVKRDREHWVNMLTPQRAPTLPAGWLESEPRSVEYLRQAQANKKLYDQRFFDNTAIGESVKKVLEQERKQKLQGIVVIADGRRTLGSLQSAYDLAKDANIPIFVIGVGKELKKVSMDIVDLRVPQLIRPEDKFRVAVSVNGTEDMANEKFDLVLDIKRIKRNKNGDPMPQNLELVKVDDKGLPLKDSDGKSMPPIDLGPRIRLLATSDKTLRNWANEPPVFKQGTPPNAQVEFELSAAEFAEAAGKKADAEAARNNTVRLGLAPDPEAEFVFQARMVKDPRELAEDRDAEIQYLMNYARENQSELARAAENLKAELGVGDAVVNLLAALQKNAGEKNGDAEFQKSLRGLRSTAQKKLNDLLKLAGKLNDTQRREATLLLGLMRGFHVSDPAGMRVQQKPLRVLLVASAASRDYQFLRTLLVREADKGRAEVSVFLQTIQGTERRVGIVQDVDPSRMLSNFPDKRTLKKEDSEPFMSLASYDVVVMFDPDLEQLSAEQKKLLNEWVDKDGGGLVYIASDLHTAELARPQHQSNRPLDPASLGTKPMLYILNMLPVVPQVQGSKGEVEGKDEPMRLVFPQIDLDTEFLRLDEADTKKNWIDGWKRYFHETQDEEGKRAAALDETKIERGFYNFWPVKSIKDNARVLAAFDTQTGVLPGNRKQPFLAVGPWGEGKVMWIGTSEVWRLRMYRDAYHERFWTKLLGDVGAKSATSVKRRITAVLPRKGVEMKTYTFEARFEDTSGDPLKRRVDPPPTIEITVGRGAEPRKGDRVRVIDGPNDKKLGIVTEVNTRRDEATGGEVRSVRVAEITNIVSEIASTDPTLREGSIVEIGNGKRGIVVKVEGNAGDRRQLTVAEVKFADPFVVDTKQVEIVIPKRAFTPRLGLKESADLDKKNDGWFKVVFQPTAAARHTIKIRQGTDESNVSIHTFDVEPAPPPDLEDQRPDLETIFAMASRPDLVYARIDEERDNEKDKAKALLIDKLKQDLERELRRVNEKRPKTKVDAVPKPGGAAPAPVQPGDDLRLVFDLESAEYIPSCMKLQVEKEREEKLPPITKDLWDDGWTLWTDYSNPKNNFVLPYWLCVAVGLLSVEWLLRKLLRLA